MLRFCPALKVAGDPVTINVLESKDDIPEFVRWIRSYKRFGLDTETTGLDWWSEDFRLRLVQFGTHDTAYVVPVEVSEDLWDAAIGAIRDIYRRGGKLALQNGTYDLLVLDAKTELRMEDIWPAVVDSKILGHLVDSRAVKEGGTGHSLEDLTRAYIDEEVATKIKGSMAELAKSMKTTKGEVFKNIDTWHPGYLLYSGLDPILSFRLARKLGPLVPTTARKLIAFEHRVAEICSYMSRRGVRLDIKYTKALIQKLYADELEWTAIARDLGCENPWSTDQLAIALVKMGAVKLPAALETLLRHKTREEIVEALNETWAELADEENWWIVDADALQLGENKNMKPKVDKDVLKVLRKRGNLLAAAVHHAKAARKKRTTWLEGFLAAVDSNGYIHPWINSIQARTARMSITGIPAQTLPAGDPEIRHCFLADPGHVMVSTDYSNMELRFLAAHSGDRRMLTAFRNGEDLHQLLADAAGVSRKEGKMADFLIVFGGTYKTLAAQANIPEAKAKHIMDTFMATYPGVAKFMEQKTAEARKFGYIVTPSGRRLYVDKSRAYSGTNYFVQSGSRDITCRALIRLYEAGFMPYMLLPIHDEILFTVPRKHAERGAKMTAQLMTEVIKGLEIPTDPEFAEESWGSLLEKEDSKH